MIFSCHVQHSNLDSPAGNNEEPFNLIRDRQIEGLFLVGSKILSLGLRCGSLTWIWDFAASSWEYREWASGSSALNFWFAREMLSPTSALVGPQRPQRILLLFSKLKRASININHKQMVILYNTYWFLSQELDYEGSSIFRIKVLLTRSGLWILLRDKAPKHQWTNFLESENIVVLWRALHENIHTHIHIIHIYCWNNSRIVLHTILLMFHQ